MNELDILKEEKKLRDKRFEIESLRNNLILGINELFIKHGEDYLKDLKEFNDKYGTIKSKN